MPHVWFLGESKGAMGWAQERECAYIHWTLCVVNLLNTLGFNLCKVRRGVSNIIY